MRERKASYCYYHHYHYHYYHSGVTCLGKQLCCHEITGHTQFSLCSQIYFTIADLPALVPSCVWLSAGMADFEWA